MENPLTELAYARAEHARTAIVRRMRAVGRCLESAARLDQMVLRWSRLEAKLLRRVASQRGGARHAENRRVEAMRTNAHSRCCEANAARMRSTARKLEQHVHDHAAKLLEAFNDA